MVYARQSVFFDISDSLKQLLMIACSSLLPRLAIVLFGLLDPAILKVCQYLRENVDAVAEGCIFVGSYQVGHLIRQRCYSSIRVCNGPACLDSVDTFSNLLKLLGNSVGRSRCLEKECPFCQFQERGFDLRKKSGRFVEVLR